MLVALVGCERNYEFDRESDPQIVLMSLINPDSQILVDLYWTQKYYEPMLFRRVENAEVVLYQNDVEIARRISGNGSVVFDGIRPVCGSKYTLKVKEASRDTLQASTIVPTPVGATANMYDMDSSYVTLKNVKITDIDISEPNFEYISIQAYTIVDQSKLPDYGYEWESYDGSDYTKPNHRLIYDESMYYDDFNASGDATFQWKYLIGTDVSCSYIRLNRKLVSQVLPIDMHVDKELYPNNTVRLRPKNSWYYPELYPDLEAVTITVFKSYLIRVAAMDKHYDAYRKAEYLLQAFNGQMAFRPMEAIITGKEPCGLPSNVHNGLGIFGSYSAVDFIFAGDEIVEM